MRKITIFQLFLPLLLIGCMPNPYYKHMQAVNTSKHKKVKTVSVYDYTQQNLDYFLNNGYTIKGKAALRSTYIGIEMAKDAAKRCGAEIILYKHEYIGTAKGSMVLPWYNEGKTYTIKQNTQGNVNVGSDGYSLNNTGNYTGNYSQNVTTTVKSPDYYTYVKVPYSRDYYDQYVLFLAKVEVKTVNKKRTLKNPCPMWDRPDLLAARFLGNTQSTEIYVIEEVNEFSKITSGNVTGYIYSDNIK